MINIVVIKDNKDLNQEVVVEIEVIIEIKVIIIENKVGIIDRDLEVGIIIEVDDKITKDLDQDQEIEINIENIKKDDF